MSRLTAGRLIALALILSGVGAGLVLGRMTVRDAVRVAEQTGYAEGSLHTMQAWVQSNRVILAGTTPTCRRK